MSKLIRTARTALPALRPIGLSRPLSATSYRLNVAPDPWPLPLSPDTISREKYVPERLSDDSESWNMPQPLDRTGEDEATMRARLVYQARKRGCLEGDLLLATYAKENLPTMGMEDMKVFDKVSLLSDWKRSRPVYTMTLTCQMLDEPDWDIFYWSVEKKEPPPRWKDSPLLEA
jgi:succinate dehydrogenase assembly factor 2